MIRRALVIGALCALGAASAHAGLDPATRQALHDATTLHYRYRFDPAGIDAGARRALRAKCRAIAATLD